MMFRERETRRLTLASVAVVSDCLDLVWEDQYSVAALAALAFRAVKHVLAYLASTAYGALSNRAEVLCLMR